jgi:prefoldin subunit 5
MQVDALKVAIARDSKKSVSQLEKRLDSLEEAMRTQLAVMSKQLGDIRQALARPRTVMQRA